MPKEQPCLSGHSPCAPSSKNAKDKTNSTTLLALRDTKDTDESSGRGSRCSSEKDSGYSDGSDWQHTDVEDQHSSKSQSRGGGESAEASQPGQNRDRGQETPGNPGPTPAGRKLPPVYIIKNMVLKPPDTIQKRGQLIWRTKSRETGSSGAPHMILCQQPRLLPTTPQLHKPPSRKSYVTGKKSASGTYLPIFNSYPRIAPHPSKKPPDKPSSNEEEAQNLSKRVCTERKGDNAPVTRSLPEEPKAAVSAIRQPCSSSTRESLTSSSSTSLHSVKGLHRNGAAGARHRRFLNTVEILRQSGLLDITLRTKELLRQSNATSRDIAQLRQHTALLCQAASSSSSSSPPDGTAAWERLHRAMAESSSYPDLRPPRDFRTPSRPGPADGPPAADTSEARPPRLLARLLDPNHNCLGQSEELEAGGKTSEKVTFMPPDSSTG